MPRIEWIAVSSRMSGRTRKQKAPDWANFRVDPPGACIELVVCAENQMGPPSS